MTPEIFIAEYKNGLSTHKIAAKYNVSIGKVYRLLKQNEVPMRPPVSTGRQYHQDEHFFDEPLSLEACWVLGWLWTDGSINSIPSIPTIRIAVQQRDKILLERIKRVMGIENPIRPVPQTKAEVLCIQNKILYAKVVSFGLTPNKSLTIGPPNIEFSNQQLAAFLLGVFEGDGCIGIYKKKGKVKFYKSNLVIRISSGSMKFLEWIRDKTIELGLTPTNIKSFQRKQYAPELDLSFNSKQVIKFCDFIYSCGIIGLERKHSIYQTGKTLPSRVGFE